MSQHVSEVVAIQFFQTLEVLERGTRNDAGGDKHVREVLVSVIENYKHFRDDPEYKRQETLELLTLAYIEDEITTAYDKLTELAKFCCPRAEAAARWGFALGMKKARLEAGG